MQPHSGAQANAAAYLALLKPGDTILGLDLSQGGHLTHGSPVNFSGLLYQAVHYGVTDEGLIDYDACVPSAREHRPALDHRRRQCLRADPRFRGVRGRRA